MPMNAWVVSVCHRPAPTQWVMLSVVTGTHAPTGRAATPEAVLLPPQEHCSACMCTYMCKKPCACHHGRYADSQYNGEY